MHEYMFNVAMSCSGCSNAVNRVLTKLPGVQDIDISLEKQLVNVKTDDSLQLDAVLEAIKKTGKAVHESKIIA
ncbi:copper chaperone Atx1p [Trichomonascus vanleenenianus]|uniref:copper metallochaperone ATX1 n=1 Tax=Trichomonascus vanleenenianus TaxID=2268995 RepID=UPI003ECA9F5E